MLKISQELSLEAIQIFGGLTESIFPEVETMIIENQEYQEAIEYVASKKDIIKYRSLIDFLFCELHLEWVWPCFSFYKDKGKRLKDKITNEQLQKFNKRLIVALEVAHKLYKEQRCKSWFYFIERLDIEIDSKK